MPESAWLEMKPPVEAEAARWMSASRHVPQQCPHPLTRCSLTHRFAFSVPVARPGTPFDEKPDDARLLLARFRGSAASSAGILNGQVEWGRARPVRLSWVGTAVHQGLDGSERSSPNSPMQRRHAVTIHRVGVSSNRDQVRDRFSLCDRVPMVGVRCVVKRLRSSPVLRMAIGAARNQQFGDRAPKRRRSDVERCVPGVHVVSDLWKEKGGGALSRGPFGRRHRREHWRRDQAARHFVAVCFGDQPEETKEGHPGMLEDDAYREKGDGPSTIAP